MEPTNLPAKRLNETSGEDKPQIFRTLRNIDLNLLTIFEAVYVHKGIVNAAKILNLTPSAISQSIQNCARYFPIRYLFVKAGRNPNRVRHPSARVHQPWSGINTGRAGSHRQLR